MLILNDTSFAESGKPVGICPERGQNVARFRIVADSAEAVAQAFDTNRQYSRAWESDGSDEPLTEDLTAYSVPGAIVDWRDGTYTVWMGMPTAAESLNTITGGNGGSGLVVVTLVAYA